MAGKVASFRAPPPICALPAPQHTITMQDPSPNPETHINARSHTLTHTPCPRESTGVGGWRGVPNYLSRFQQMVKNFLQGRQLLQQLGPSLLKTLCVLHPPKTASQQRSLDPERPFFFSIVASDLLDSARTLD